MKNPLHMGKHDLISYGCVMQESRTDDMINTTLPPVPVRAEAEADLTTSNESRVVAMLPPQLLQNDEAIVLLLKPSPWFVLLESLGTLAVLALALAASLTLINLQLIEGAQRDLVFATIGLVAVLKIFWQFLEWLSRIYVLTDRRMIRVKGVLRVQVFEATLRNIQHTTTVFSIRERLFSLGTLAFATAGTGVHEAAWTMIAHPLKVNQIVTQTLSRYR